MELKSETKYQKVTQDFELIIKLGKQFKNEVELWRNIYGYDNYSVSTYGNVRNDKTNKILKPGLNGEGYHSVNLCKNGITKTKKIHKLVANAFISNSDNKQCIDHKDENKTNNNVSNLRYATKSENNMNKQNQSNNTSGIKGVTWNKKASKWLAQIKFNNKNIYLGIFASIEDAKKARQDKAKELFGEYINKCEL